MTLLRFVVAAMLVGSVTALRLPGLDSQITVDTDLSEATLLSTYLFVVLAD